VSWAVLDCKCCVRVSAIAWPINSEHQYQLVTCDAESQNQKCIAIVFLARLVCKVVIKHIDEETASFDSVHKHRLKMWCQSELREVSALGLIENFAAILLSWNILRNKPGFATQVVRFYKLSKFQDFQVTMASNSRTFKHLPCIQLVSSKGKTKEVYCCDIVVLIILFWCFWRVKD